MSTYREGMTTEVHEERLLAQVAGVKLERGGKGKLLLTNKRIQFESKSGLFSPPHVELCLDLCQLSPIEVDEASNTLVLEWQQEDGERAVNRLHLPRGEAANNLCRSLDYTLESLRYELERRERTTRYQAFLWKTAYNVWVIAGLLLQIVRELTHDDWEAVEATLCEVEETADALAAEGAVNIGEQVHTLMETVPSRDATLVLRNTIAALKAIGISLANDLYPADDWGELALENSPGLNWRDIRSVFLFAGNYNLVSLWQHLGETEEIERSLPLLARLSSVLADRICGRSEPEDSSEELEASSIIGNIESATQDFEALLKMNSGIF